MDVCNYGCIHIYSCSDFFQSSAIICYQMQSNAIIHSFTHSASASSHWPFPHLKLKPASQEPDMLLLSSFLLYSPHSSFFSLPFPFPGPNCCFLIRPDSCAPVSRKCVRSLNANIFAECQWRPSTIVAFLPSYSSICPSISRCPAFPYFISLSRCLSLSPLSLFSLS